MSEEQFESPKSDPFAQVIDFYDTWTKAWAGTMSETVASERFAETMAQQMEGSMEVMSLLRRQVAETMDQYLAQMNLPSRKEVIGLAERLTRIEMTIDDLDAKLDEILDRLEVSQESDPD